MRLFVGLGNPGERYKGTRHNTGFLVLDQLKNEIPNSKLQITNKIKDLNFQYEEKFKAEILKIGDIILAKPQTFMNKSGEAVSRIASFYKIKQNNLYVVHDDLDIKFGEYKIQKGVGPKLHYGIQSIENKIRNKDFWRIRIGVDNRSKEFSIFPPKTNQSRADNFQFSRRTPGEEYVLQKFTDEEMVILNVVIKKAVKEMINIISD